MIKVKKVRPMANYMLVTKDVYTSKDFEGTIQAKVDGSIKEYQKVIAVGPMVRNIKEGDMIWINPSRYFKLEYKEGSIKNDIQEMKKAPRYEIPTFEVDGIQYLMLTDQDVYFVIDEFEEEKPESGLILPKKEIIS